MPLEGEGGVALSTSAVRAPARGHAVASIDLTALRANFAEVKRLAGGAAVIAVVKADAYGHGAEPVARTLVDAGCDQLATWSVSEAATLRDAGIQAPILVLAGAQDAAEAEAAVATRLVPVVHDEGGRERLVGAARRLGGAPAPVHVEIDTGMRRMGLPADAAADFLREVHREPALQLAGVMTHFARADEADLEPTREQWSRFQAVLGPLAGEVPLGSVHVANSAGLVSWPDLQLAGPPPDAVRPGLMLYGAQPCVTRSATLRPVMSLRAPVVAVRRVRAGDAVGYGARYRAPRDTTVATLGLGYADGLPISLTNRGAVWLGGGLRPLAGRVSMDSVGVDVGDAPITVGALATVFGVAEPGGPVVAPIETAAAHAETLSYELLVRVGQRVPRVYAESGASV
ncbi:MAG: alanine racemase [Myxococcota bacterium]